MLENLFRPKVSHITVLSSAKNLYALIHTSMGQHRPECAILSLMPKLEFLSNVLLIVFDLLQDTQRFIRVGLRPRCALAAENLFLRKQLPYLGNPEWHYPSSRPEYRPKYPLLSFLKGPCAHRIRLTRIEPSVKTNLVWRTVNKLVREPKASTKGNQHFTDILAGQSGRRFVGLAVKFERVRWSGR